jgi:hypothetical protein
MEPTIGSRRLATLLLALSTAFDLMDTKDPEVIFVIIFTANQVTVVSKF